jgi:hypothetical protein
MKALPMLDHVSCWIVTVSSALCLVSGVISTYDSLFFPSHDQFQSNFWISVSGVALTALWMTCAWRPLNVLSRLVLGFSGSLFLARIGQMFLDAISHDDAVASGFGFIVLYSIPVLAFGSMLWIACRIRSKSSASYSLSNSINSVCLP